MCILDEEELDPTTEAGETVANVSPGEAVDETNEQDSISLNSVPSLRFEPVEDYKPGEKGFRETINQVVKFPLRKLFFQIIYLRRMPSLFLFKISRVSKIYF